jgi:C-terminal processing protease CtpA/Prc
MRADVRRAAVARLVETATRRPPERGRLSVEERRQVVSTFIALIEGLYAHLPQKRATYGHDPVQRLRSLEQRLSALTDRDFHRTVAQIITDLRDAHTRYLGPISIEEEAAILPFAVERCGADSDERYIVSHVSEVLVEEWRRLQRAAFVPGVEVTHWNGIPIRRAVELHADRETGGRSDARRARATESLTLRPLRYALPPDEEWVIVSFLTLGGKPREVRLSWQFVKKDDRLRIDIEQALHRPAAFAYAANPAAEAARRLKKFLFATEKWEEAASGTLPRLSESVRDNKRAGNWFTGRFQDAVAARVIETGAGTFGHLRLWSFDVLDDDAFLAEVIELLEHLPRTGLIIDLRGNPGGLVWAAERLLQLFTPEPVSPAMFSVRATDLTRTMAGAPQSRRTLAPWRRSLEAAVVNGELYSRGVPLTPPERCNDIGQRYPGPVVAVVDANTYSAGDLFAAGFVDNGIGTLVSVDEATGAGGANVWFPGHVSGSLEGTPASMERLPAGISYTVAFRRAVRVGEVAGTGIEDVGVPGHLRHTLTQRDLTDGNADLLAFCGRLLATLPTTDLVAAIDGQTLTIETSNLDRVDIRVDGRPDRPLRADRHGTTTLDYQLDPRWSHIEIAGYAGTVRRQRRVLHPPTPAPAAQ